MAASFDVRIWTTRVYKGRTTSTHYVRWKVADQPFQEGFRTSGLADSFRSQLVTASRVGEAFDTVTGLPVSLVRSETSASWYEFAVSYIDMKWPDAAGKSRAGIAESMTTVTLALTKMTGGAPDPKTLRRALYSWAFNTRARSAGPPSPELARAVRFIEHNTRPVADLAQPEIIRAALASIGRRLDGTGAAAATNQRKRAILFNALEFAVERKMLTANPLTTLKVKRRAVAEEIDRRVVVNREQADLLLAAVSKCGKSGERLTAFFGLMYYSALRPAEAADLSETALQLPVGEGWGEVFLPGSAPTTGTAWSDSGRRRDTRGLKHRPREATRVVPLPPPLITLIKRHLDEFGTNSRGRLFGATRDRERDLSDSVYGRIWASARTSVFSPEEAASPLARRPYDLRHAAVSTWLNAGVPPTQVAEWAGHSVAVLLRVYAKCISGQEDAARARVGHALGLD